MIPQDRIGDENHETLHWSSTPPFISKLRAELRLTGNKLYL